jgi:Asp-tRNA(Asn)/Glu-tRNA(Gln) amidotransferase A subunit family amidase
LLKIMKSGEIITGEYLKNGSVLIEKYFKNAVVFVAVFLILCLLPMAMGCDGEVDTSSIREAEKIAGLEFTPAERDSMLGNIKDNLVSYQNIREMNISNSVPPALYFDPIPAGTDLEQKKDRLELGPSPGLEMPDDIEELAFCSVRELAALIRSGRVTSLELTKMYIDRLKRYGDELECVITLTEDMAIRQARRADREIARGKYRGLLHGIPYGVKDLFAVEGYKTTWGAMPYRDQSIEESATVVRKLEDAGAVLVAKLTLGALAWGDVWYGGKTRNPWDTGEGSSGSSAGSASATAAGLVAFSLGTETWGSIVSPCTRCGATGLRPTFGRVSRAGAMALSWSMDKVGPICRSAEDCAIVFNAIRGPDGKDPTVVDVPFDYRAGIDLASLKIGYLKDLFESDYPNRQTDSTTLEKMQDLGAELVSIELPQYPVESMAFILDAEAATAFDKLTRSNRDDLMVRQIRNAWPNVFRAARFIPAVEYIQANRLRYMLIEDMQKMDVDLYLAPSFEGNNLLLTNLTGHPCVVLPNGFDHEGNPVSISLIGKLFDEGTLLAVARLYQEATDFDDRHPPQFKP